jgi:predicted amidohydrolase
MVEKRLFRRRSTFPGGPVSQLLQEWSAGKRLVVCGLCEVDGEVLYNAAAVFGSGEYLATYRKAHLFMKETGHIRSRCRDPSGS